MFQELVKTQTAREVTAMHMMECLKMLPHGLHLPEHPCSAHDTVLPEPIHTVI